MKTATDRLRFAVAFAGMDLDALRPGDWSNLRDSLDAFTRAVEPQAPSAFGGIIPTVCPDPPLALDYPEEACRQLQRETHQTLAGIAEPGGPQGGMTVTVTRYLSLPPPPLRSQRKQWATLWVMGNVRAVFLEILFALLTQAPLPPVGKCPECGKLFYRVRRQKYCDRPCANRVNMRLFMAKKANRAAKREADHRAYERRVRRKNGNAKLKTTRRPRKRQA